VVLESAQIDALLVGSGEPDDELGREVATTIGSAYLLDFHDEAASTRRFDAGVKREKWLRTHPAGFLRDHGIIAPGWEPRTSPVRTVEIVEGVAPEKVRKVFARDGMQFVAHSRGTLVLNDPGPGTFKYAAKLKTNVLSVLHNTRDGAFSCETIRPDGSVQGFFIGSFTNLEMCEVVESVSGATTPLEICKTLEIDPALLGLSKK
jgi:hypothetical protein